MKIDQTEDRLSIARSRADVEGPPSRSMIYASDHSVPPTPTERFLAPLGMTRVVLFCVLLAICGVANLHAQTSTSSPSSTPSIEQRVADLEAYMNNSARGADSANAATASNINGPGPGHNGWMMTCAALVLFMILPGLALFYGGLVRQKNVLSVLAQCLGIAGLVTILWWAVGYSLVFSRGSPFLGGFRFAFLRGVD